MVALDSTALQASLARPRLQLGADLTRVRAAILLTDAIIITAATFGAQLFRFGGPSVAPSLAVGATGIDYLIVSSVISVLWLVGLGAFRTLDLRVLGVGDQEYKGVVLASGATFVAVALVSFALQLEVARGYLAIAFPLGLGALLLSRKLWRTWIGGRRAKGDFLTSVIVLGDADETHGLVAKINGTPRSGLKVVGASDSVERIGHTAKALHASAVILAGGVWGEPLNARAVSWELEKHGLELIVPSPLVGIDQMRVQHRPAGSLPLMHVEMPEYSGARRVAKRAFDWVASGLGLIVLSPLFAVLAALIKLEDGGTVFFRQERIGRNGTPFSILKFRTMVPNAEALKAELADQNEGGGPLFKMRNDPRVTRLGRLLRRSSLDELPQLWNVFTGSMSLVGPRPGLPSEVAKYEEHVERRLLVSPGITGLWQVAGRSDLSWEQGVQLDLDYVENWTIGLDFSILARTVRAVTKSSGAY
ncbi:MAG: sugar transferase [Leucobacter sp.]